MLEDKCGTSLTGGRIKCADWSNGSHFCFLELICGRQESVTLSQGQSGLIE